MQNRLYNKSKCLPTKESYVSAPPHDLLVSFMFDHGTPVVFRGHTNGPVETFNGTATITYSDQSELTGSEQFSGTIGSETLQLTLGESGAKISGRADDPSGNPDVDVQGEGTWG